MKYELSLDASYLSGSNGWDVAAGIRELVQNGRDAEIEQKAPLTVSHSGTRLVIENEGARLPREALLIGCSTKRGNAEMAGQWGEGLKLGCLVLVRAGYGVKIRSGSEVWVPTIEPSEKFGGREVLVFNVDGGREERARVRIEIEGVSADDWKALREHFLFLYKRDIPSVATRTGTLLLSDKFCGRVYVKGILVQTNPRLSHGYDFSRVELDRDRRLIGDWDLESQVREIWTEALATRPDLLDPFAALLEKNAKDVQGFQYYAGSLPDAAAEHVAARFVKRHGDKAIAVQTLSDGQDLEHLGWRGVVAAEPLRAVLNRILGDAATVKERLREEVLETFSWHDLDATERRNVEGAIELVAPHTVKAAVTPDGAVSLNDVDVVAFRSPTLLGQFKDGRILLARRILKSRSETLETVVHEAAHREGGDGDGDGEKGHVAEIERIWAAIVEGLRG